MVVYGDLNYDSIRKEYLAKSCAPSYPTRGRWSPQTRVRL